MSEEVVKRGRKPRDPNAPKQKRKARVLGILIVAKDGRISFVKASRDPFALMEEMDNFRASGEYSDVTLRRLEIE